MACDVPGKPVTLLKAGTVRYRAVELCAGHLTDATVNLGYEQQRTVDK